MKNKETKLLAISSGKGGVGKSNIATNLALTYVQDKKKVLLLDADLGLSNTNILLGIYPPFTLFHVLKGLKTLEESIYYTQQGLYLISGGSGFSQIANMSMQQKEYIKDQFKLLPHFDVIIIDTGAGISNNVLFFLRLVEEIILISTTEPTAITDVYGLIKVLCTESKINFQKMNLVINRVKNDAEGQLIARKISKISEQFLNNEVQYLSSIREDSSVIKAVKAQIPFILAYPHTLASIDLRNMYATLNHKPSYAKRSISNIWDYFFK